MIPLIIGLALMVCLILGGVWIAVSIGTSGTLALIPILGTKTWDIIGIQFWSTTRSFVLAAIPLFVFMGEFVSHTGMTGRVYTGLAKALRGVPGGLEQTNIAACAVFAAASGSSVAGSATMGRTAFPELVARGYDKTLTLGSICAGGTLGILIPPSITMIIYGAVAEESVGQLFIAGLFPGLTLAALYMLYIALRVILQPGLVPREETTGFGLGVRLSGLVEIWPFLTLMVMVLGTIYLGIATPTEAAAAGAASAIAIAGVYRLLTWRAVTDTAWATMQTTCMLFLIIMCAKVMVMALGYYGVSYAMRQWMLGLGSPLVAYSLIIGIYFIMGCFFEVVSMMILTIPIFLPIMMAFGYTKVWFGVVVTVCMEAAQLTPPVGLNLFVMQGVTGEPLERIIRGTWPYVITILILAAILYVWPDLALWLPNLMYGV